MRPKAHGAWCTRRRTRQDSVVLLSSSSAGDDPSYSIDPSALWQIRLHPLLNLVQLGYTTNAIVYSPKGGSSLSLDMESTSSTLILIRGTVFGPGNVSPGATYAVQEGELYGLYWNFGEKKNGTPKGFGNERVHGRPLLGARRGAFVFFWDWETSEIVRRVDVGLPM